MEMGNNKFILNVSELAKYLGIGKNSAYTLVHTKGFPKIRVGRKILIPIKPLEKWLDNTMDN